MYQLLLSRYRVILYECKEKRAWQINGMRASMFYRITFNNLDAVAESEDGKAWYIRTGYSTYQVPTTDRGCSIEDALFLGGYSIRSISCVSGENIFGFKAAEGRWEVIRKEGDTKKVVGYIYETGEPILCYRYESADKKKEIRSNSLMRLLVQLKPRNWK